MSVPRGRGNPDAKLFFVGEAWGKYEREKGLPFQGPAGRVLDELLLKSGIRPQDCYFSNIINDQPPDNDLAQWMRWGVPNDRVAEGIDSLREEIERVRPNVIVPLGNWPLWLFYGHKRFSKQGEPTGILDYRGYVLEARKLARGTKIIPCVHPSHILQGGYPDSGLAIRHLQRAHKESHFPDIRRKPRLSIIDPQGDEREAIRHRLLSEGRRLVLDIEYVGSRLLCVGFAVSSDWATTIRIRSPADLAWCQSLIESGRPLCAQNAMFDLGILDWHYHIDAFKHMDLDTMVAAYNINIEYKKDLGALASLYELDIPAWWDVIDWDAIKAGKQSTDLVWEYNCLDNMVTYEIMEGQELDLATDPKMLEAFRFDMRKLPALWRMSKRGIPIDFDHIAKLKDKAENDELEGQAILNIMAQGMDIVPSGVDLNVLSPIQVPEFLASLGMQLTRTTEKSKPSKPRYKIDNITLMEEMRNARTSAQKKAIEWILRVRDARGIKSKTIEIEWDEDGRARCIWDGTKTTTRRLSSKTFFPTGKGSNLQNMPAPNSSPRYGKDVRRIFKPDPGHEFGYADLKGAEFEIVAELTQDRKMLEYVEMSHTGKGNVHKETAAFMFDLPDPNAVDKGSAFYFLGKKMRHSGNYMIGWKELMGRINAEAMETGVFVEAAEVKRMIEKYLMLHPGLPVWWREIEHEVRSNGGLIRNLFGFPRVFHNHISRCLPTVVAHKPQSTVGDCLNFGLLACDADPDLADAGFQLFLNVHDAIGFQYPIENRDFVLPRVRENLSIPIPIPKTGKELIIPVELEIGPNWGDLEEWHG